MKVCASHDANLRRNHSFDAAELRTGKISRQTQVTLVQKPMASDKHQARGTFKNTA